MPLVVCGVAVGHWRQQDFQMVVKGGQVHTSDWTPFHTSGQPISTTKEGNYLRMKIDGVDFRPYFHKALKESALGRPTLKGTHVHHKDKVFGHSELANLEEVIIATHMELHNHNARRAR